jgi:D-alanine-D-alanine ligase
MRVLIAYNEPVLPATHPEADSEREILDVVNAVDQHLLSTGLEVTRQGVGRDLIAFHDTLQATTPDIVLNLFEGFGDDPMSECRFARLLEQQGAAFTGASSRTLWNAGRKDIAKQHFQTAGLQTPAFVAVNELPFDKCSLQWPVIVKPAFRDASCGIHQSSIATNDQQLAILIDRTAREYGFPVLVEEFIEGREISAAIFDWPELTVLPAVETVIEAEGLDWPIVGYEAKWRPGSRDHDAISLRYPAELAPHLAARVATVARGAYRALDCSGFATIDARLTCDGQLYLLELNPNGDIKPSACLVASLQSIGIDYTEFLVQMILSKKTKFAVAAAKSKIA